MKPSVGKRLTGQERKTIRKLKNRLGRMSLRGRIFTYLLLFSLLLLILLWLMQVVYLDTFYEEVKTTQIESTGDQLAASLESDNLPELVSTLAQKRQICVSIYQVKNPDLFLISSEEIARACVLSDCVIHHLGSANVALFYSYATSQGGHLYRALRAHPFPTGKQG